MQNTSELVQSVPTESVKRRLSDRAAVTLFKGKGCEVCHNTGYTGRVGIFEVLVISDAIRSLISTKSPSEIIRQKAIAEGMTTMMDDGLEKVLQGITTIEEIVRTTKE